MSTPCEQAGNIQDLKKAIFGNGRPGLIESVVRLDERINKLDDRINLLDNRINKLDESLGTLSTAIGGLARFQSEISGEKNSKHTIQWLIGLNVTTVLGLLTAIITML